MLRMISLLGCLMLLTTCLGVPSALAVNKVLSLDGEGHVEVPHIDFTGVFTVEARILIGEFLLDGDNAIVRQVFGPHVQNMLFHLVIRYKKPYLGFYKNGLSSQTVLEVNKWYHLAFQYTGSEQRIYINGHLDAVREATPYENTEGATTIGSHFRGLMDEVRIWNVARTQEQIQETMNQPLENPELLDNLVGYWNFDGGTPDDLSQHENHGTLYGDAYIADVIYISPDGSPTGDGTKENPYDTIQRGIDESRRGDIVQVLPGTYEEDIRLYSDLIVLGSGVENTTIMAASGNIVTANNVHNVSFLGFTLDGQGSADYGILCSGTTSEMEIKNNIITSATTGIGCSDSASVTIKNNTVSLNSGNGIDCGDSTSITVDGNNIEGNERHGVSLHGNSVIDLVNNYIRRNQGYGIDCWMEADVTIQSNVIAENINIGIVCGGSSTVDIISNTIQYNLYHGTWFDGNSVVTIRDNLIHSNSVRGIAVIDSANVTVIRNIIRDNKGGGIDCWKSTTPPLIGGSLVNANNIDNPGYAINIVECDAPYNINATYNYWGTTDESEIAVMMRNEGDGSIDFIPFINSLDDIVGDTSGDGTISALDAALILQYVIGLIDRFPATSPISQAGQKYISGGISIDELDRMLQKWGYPSVFKLLGLENQLLQNYPNPFNPETWIPFKLAQSVPVTINIYDTRGQLLRTLHIGNKGAGIYVTKDKAAYWDGMDYFGQRVSSGIYYYTLQAGTFKATRKMLILK